MIEIATDDAAQAVEVGAQRHVPGQLPVLPLRESVPLPEVPASAYADPPAPPDLHKPTGGLSRPRR